MCEDRTMWKQPAQFSITLISKNSDLVCLKTKPESLGEHVLLAFAWGKNGIRRRNEETKLI